MNAVQFLIRKIKKINREKDVEQRHKESDLVLCDLVHLLLEYCPSEDVDGVNELLEVYKAKMDDWYYA